jgi:IMP dehydrogenase
MDTVTGKDMLLAMAKYGGLGILHRYNEPEQQAEIVGEVYEELEDGEYVGAAIGVTGDYLERAKLLVERGADILCMDVAHGHHILMERALKTIKDTIPQEVHVMAGNVATLKGFNDLAEWGADSIRCNIGGGSICSTRTQTGHGIPGLQTIIDCSETQHDVPIIADGGIRSPGDAVKALAAGASFVMLGSMLAGTDESPGDMIIGVLNTKTKVYRGMASKEAQFEWRGGYSSNEGISATVPYKGSVEHILTDLSNGMKSGLSYTGAKNIKELQDKSEFVYQTSAGQMEGWTHILRKNK